MNAWILRHGGIREACPLLRQNANEVVVWVGGVSYTVSFGIVAEQYAHLAVFDGVLLPHGLSRSVRILPNTSERGSFNAALPELMTASSLTAKVRRDPGLPIGMKLLKQSVLTGYRKVRKGSIDVTFARWFLSFQRGKNTRSLVFRYKPVSLERNYVSIESHQDEVKFVTLNDW